MNLSWDWTMDVSLGSLMLEHLFDHISHAEVVSIGLASIVWCLLVSPRQVLNHSEIMDLVIGGVLSGS
jgi:hypothetical protein